MEVWKPPNYRLPDARKGKEPQAQLLLMNRGTSCGNYTRLIFSIAMDCRYISTDEISIHCNLSVTAPETTQ